MSHGQQFGGQSGIPVNPNAPNAHGSNGQNTFNALTVFGQPILPVVVDHTTKQMYDQRFQELQAQLDSMKSKVEQSYTHYTALEKAVETGERAKQELAALRGTDLSTFQRPAPIGPAGPSTSRSTLPLVYQAAAHLPVELPSSARIEELPSPPQAMRHYPHSTTQSVQPSQIPIPPLYSYYLPRPPETQFHPAPQLSSSYVPHAQNHQSRPLASQRPPSVAARPPAKQPHKQLVPEIVPPPPPSRFSNQASTSQATPPPPVSAYSSLNGALGAGPQSDSKPTPAKAIPNQATLANQTKPSTSVLPKPSDSTTRSLPTTSSSDLLLSAVKSLPPDLLSAVSPHVSSVIEFMKKVEDFAQRGAPNTEFCRMETINVYKDKEGRVWIQLSARGRSETFAWEGVTLETILQYVKVWKGSAAPLQPTPATSSYSAQLNTLPASVANPAPSTPKQNPTLPPKPATDASTSTVPVAVPASAPKSNIPSLKSVPFKSPQKGLATAVLIALGRKPSVAKENFEGKPPNAQSAAEPKPTPPTSKPPQPTTSNPPRTTPNPQPTTVKPQPTTSNPPPTTPNPPPTTMNPPPTTLKPPPTTTNAEQQPSTSNNKDGVDAGVIPPIAHLSPSPTPSNQAADLPTLSATPLQPQEIKVTSSSSSSLSSVSVQPAAPAVVPPLFTTWSHRPSSRAAPPIQPYHSLAINQPRPLGTVMIIPPVAVQQPPSFPASSTTPSSIPRKRPRLSPTVEIPLRTPIKSPKKVKEAPTPLFLPESTPPSEAMEVDSIAPRAPSPSLRFEPIDATPIRMKSWPKHNVVEVVIPPPPDYVREFLNQEGGRASSQGPKSLRSRTGSASADSHAGSLFTEPDPADMKLVLEASAKMRMCRCKWRDCDVTMNSAGNLLLHLRLVHGAEVGTIGHGQQFSYVCAWQHCGQMYKEKSRLFKHFERHSIYPLRCRHEGCEETARTPRQLGQHYLEDHTEDEPIKTSLDPIEPSSLSQPLNLPPTLPPYIAAAQVMSTGIPKERHEAFGPWVLRRIVGSVNNRPKRHNVAAIHLSHSNPYEFLGTFNKLSRVPDLEDLNSSEVSYAANNGLTLWPGPSSKVPSDPSGSDVDVKPELDDI